MKLWCVVWTLLMTHRSSNEEINKAFRTMSLKHHPDPDKSGDNETFAKNNGARQIIRLAMDM